MSHISDNDRAAARCDGCGNIYPANIRPEGDVVPIGITHCGDCGGSEFTAFGEHGKELVSTGE